MATERTLYRAASDDYVDTGYAFAESLEDAEAYLDNPGFGGARLWRAAVEVEESAVLDLTATSTSELAAMLDLHDPGAIGVDEWLPRSPRVTDGIRARGHLWAIVAESYPAGSRTWIWCGTFEDGEPELEAIA